MVSSDIPPPPPTTEPPVDDLTLPKRPPEIIKARPLTIKKQPPSEIPRLRNGNFTISQNQSQSSEVRSTKEDEDFSENHYNVDTSKYSSNRRIEMPPAFLFPESETPPADLLTSTVDQDQVDRVALPCQENLHNEDSPHSDKSSEESIDVETRNNINKEQCSKFQIFLICS